jgi:hypothetical protein
MIVFSPLFFRVSLSKVILDSGESSILLKHITHDTEQDTEIVLSWRNRPVFLAPRDPKT